MEEEIIEDGKIINKMIPEAIQDSTNYSKEIKKRMKLNNIFSEFENKATNDLNFFIDESNRRYTKSKCGINLNSLISSTRKKCLNESIKILNDNFYNNKIIDDERAKMKFKSAQKYYKKIKNTFNIIRNPELKRKELYLEDINDIDLNNNNDNNKESTINVIRKNYNNNNEKRNASISYNWKYEPSNRIKDRNKINSIINYENRIIHQSIDNYKSNLNNLKYNFEEKKVKNGFHLNIPKKIKFNLPKLKLLNYAKDKVKLDKPNQDDENKKADIHKLIPFSKYAKYCFGLSTKNISFDKSKIKENKDNTLPYITEPSVPDNNHYYKNYNNTIFVVANSANKELFVNKNYDKKREDFENILKVDDIPELKFYEKIIHKKANNLAQKRRERNEIISKEQNYHKLTNKQRMNYDIERNINLIKNIEDSLYGKENKKINISN